MKRQKRLVRAVAVLAIVDALLLLALIYAYRPQEGAPITDEPNYTLFIEEDGRATVNVEDIAYVRQEDDGTLVIQGDGQMPLP